MDQWFHLADWGQGVTWWEADTSFQKDSKFNNNNTINNGTVNNNLALTASVVSEPRLSRLVPATPRHTANSRTHA